MKPPNIYAPRKPMNKKLIVANWKMLPETLAQAREILETVNNYLEPLSELELEHIGIIFCPPFVFIEEVEKMMSLSRLRTAALLGAQDIAPQSQGALTGEVSASMLERLGVQYVIIGHSERRWKLGENDEVVNAKLKTALENGFIPIICIGERTRVGDWKHELDEQIKGSLRGLSQDSVARCIVAYEPVWAISTNPGSHSDTPESASASIEYIEEFLHQEYGTGAARYLYGGSVTAENAEGFLQRKEISGALVGGASVRKEEFIEILNIARQFSK